MRNLICTAIEIEVGVLDVLHFLSDFDIKGIVDGLWVETLVEWFRCNVEVLRVLNGRFNSVLGGK